MPRLPYISLRLAAGWRKTLRHAWSLRLFALAALLSVIEAALQAFGGSLPPIITILLIPLLSIGGLVARLVAQKDLLGENE